jgi:hypothetical protein
MADTSEKREETAPAEPPANAPAAEPASPATEAPAGPEGVPVSADAPLHRRRRRRRRRRRHGPPQESEQAAAGASAVATGEPAPGDAAAAPAPSEVTPPATDGATPLEPTTSPAAAPLSAAPAGEPPRRRRRRRRRRKPPPGAQTTTPSASAEAGAVAAAPGEQAAGTDERPPRKPWRGRSRWRDREGETQNREQRSRDGGARTETPRGGDLGKRERDHRDKRHGRPGKPGFGRGRDRDGHGQKPEQKLYASESIVDRGFEDVAPAEEGGEVHRVDWTIVKRMMVDQRSTQTVSTIYVLKRDGAETEFPYLAAAREAVKKKIVHPEKLTRPKEDYAALYTKK